MESYLIPGPPKEFKQMEPVTPSQYFSHLEHLGPHHHHQLLLMPQQQQIRLAQAQQQIVQHPSVAFLGHSPQPQDSIPVHDISVITAASTSPKDNMVESFSITRRVKGPWSREEDELLASLVAEHGAKKWSVIAEKVPGRIGKQCRERWLNHLDTSVKKTPWTEAEDQLLLDAQKKKGNRWCEIARLLPGRPENAVKNRFNSLSNRGKLSADGRVIKIVSPLTNDEKNDEYSLDESMKQEEQTKEDGVENNNSPFSIESSSFSSPPPSLPTLVSTISFSSSAATSPQGTYPTRSAFNMEHVTTTTPPHVEPVIVNSSQEQPRVHRLPPKKAVSMRRGSSTGSLTSMEDRSTTPQTDDETLKRGKFD